MRARWLVTWVVRPTLQLDCGRNAAIAGNAETGGRVRHGRPGGVEMARRGRNDEREPLRPTSPSAPPAVDLGWGKQGFDFLGCHLRKRFSGPTWEKSRKRVYFLQRWPSTRSMKDLTPKSRCHKDPRDVIAELNPVLRGWGQYFRTGNAADKFAEVDEIA
jgi:hypothetical protein